MILPLLLPLMLASRPAAAAPSPSANGRAAVLLWLPDPDRPDWSDLDKALAEDKELRLTVAAAPDSVPEAERERLKAYAAEGRLELAARLPGDPVLPLVSDLQGAAAARGGPAPKASFARPQDIAAQLALARESFRAAFGAPPAGLAPAGGALSPELLPLTRGLGFSWVASGAYQVPGSTRGWAGADGLTVVPFALYGSTAPTADGSPVVVDETLTSTGAFEASLSALKKTRPSGWRTVSEAARAASTGPAEGALAGWAGDLSRWYAVPAQESAWSLLADASQALQRYQNSGRAGLKTLDDAAQSLYRAEAGGIFLEYGRQPSGPRLPQLDRDFRGSLARVFKLSGEPVPEDLLAPLGPAAGVATSTAPAQPFVRTGPGWIEFRNKAGSALSIPEVADRPPPWELKGFKVAWNEERITFSVSLANLKKDISAARGFGGTIVDLYIDQNHRAGSGSRALLPGRGGYVEPRDAWEYALTLSGDESALYQSRPTGPEKVLDLEPEADFQAGELRVAVDRSLLRGNPLFWGYLCASMYPEPGGSPPRPRAGDPVLLDVVSPEEASTASGSYRAVRVPRPRP